MEWVVITFSRQSSQIRDRTRVPPLCREILYYLSHQGSFFPQEPLTESPSTSRCCPGTWTLQSSTSACEQRCSTSSSSIQRALRHIKAVVEVPHQIHNMVPDARGVQSRHCWVWAGHLYPLIVRLGEMGSTEEARFYLWVHWSLLPPHPSPWHADSSAQVRALAWKIERRSWAMGVPLP